MASARRWRNEDTMPGPRRVGRRSEILGFAGGVNRDLQTAAAVPPPMTGFPEFIRKLPEAETALDGVTLWLLQGWTGSATLFQAREDSSVTEHSHGAQWGSSSRVRCASRSTRPPGRVAAATNTLCPRACRTPPPSRRGFVRSTSSTIQIDIGRGHDPPAARVTSASGRGPLSTRRRDQIY